MKRNELISVGLYLRGDNLDPKSVSNKLGVEPSDSQRKGDKKITSTNREYIRNIGIWSLIAESESLSLSDLVSQVTEQIKSDDLSLHDIDGVQEAYLDVFIARDSDENHEGTIEFELSRDNIAEIARLDLRVFFTATLVNENGN
jgi:hypothetical protein